MLGFQLQLVEFFRLQQNVVPFGVLVTLDDFFLGNLLEDILGLNAFQIVDGLSAWLVDHAEGDRLL